jgi:hypothetical protein
MEAPPVTLLDEAVLDPDVDYNPTEDTTTKYLHELNTLATIPKHDTVNQNSANFPTVLHFAFGISSTSRSELRLVSNFMPLPCSSTAYNHYMDKLQNAESALSNIERLDEQIDNFVKMNDLPERAPVSVAVGATSHDRSYLLGENADSAFVIYDQPLDRNYWRLPLHVYIGCPTSSVAQRAMR